MILPGFSNYAELPDGLSQDTVSAQEPTVLLSLERVQTRRKPASDPTGQTVYSI
jgi:hypothetical protein